jgi:lipoprotein-releasing system permease protein
MNLPFELHVALRYLLARRKQALISVISLISTVGVAVGVMALVIALALMTGLQQELRDRILGSTAHVYVWKHGGIADHRAESEALLALPRVVGAAPAIQGMALVTTGQSEAFISLKGIDPELEKTVTDIGRSMLSGRLETLVEAGEDDLPAILLGTDLAKKLGVIEGDTVRVMVAQGTLSPMGILPRSRVFAVGGLFSLGLFEFDSAYGFISLNTAARLLNKEQADMIELRVDDIYAAPRIADSIVEAMGPRYITQDWSETNRSLFSALWLEKIAISITIGLIVAVAALNIIASLILLVMEKSSDIAILKTMGASASSITAIFMLQGLVIGVVGTLLGAAGGLGVAHLLDSYQVIRVPMDVYQVSHVPFTVEWRDFVTVVLAAIVTCFLATIYPSRQAARLHPAEALRYG